MRRVTRRIAGRWVAGLALTGVGCAATVSALAAPEADRPKFQTTWSDEFSGPAGQLPNAASWNIRTGGRWAGGRELQSYTDRASNVATDGQGRLRINVRREAFTGDDEVARSFTSARIDTAGKVEARYGRVSARIRMPPGRGLLPAFWALPASLERTGVDGGELDAVEIDGRHPDVVLGSVHAPGRAGGQVHVTRHQELRGAASAGFHVYSMEWSPRDVQFSVDGKRYATVTRAEIERRGRWVFGEPFFLVLNVAVGNPLTGPPTAGTKLPATMTVDWVRVAHRRAP